MDRQKVLCLASGLITILSLLFAFSFYDQNLADTMDIPTHIHLTWQQSNMSNTITVTWQTKYANSGDVVAYDLISRNEEVPQYSYLTTGLNHTYAGASGYIHDVELSDLKPNSTYYFVCGGTKGGYSNERQFRTAPIQPSTLRFVVGGDCRSNSTQRDIVSTAMSRFNPEFVLHSGDFVDSGNNQTKWDSFFEGLHSYWVGSDNRTIPIVPCLGNHEENATNYYEQFALPNNEQWYSINWGNYVHIVILNSENSPSGAQLNWLENDLASHRYYTWTFVMLHRPLFSSGHHGNWTEGREYWCPLFDKYGVDIVFAGHDHNYERSKPINYSASKTYPQDSYSKGTMYIVSGGWGAPLYPSGINSWTAYSSSEYHFILVDVFANGTLNIETKDQLGETFDEVIQKSPVVPEFPSFLFLPLCMLTTLLLVIVYRKYCLPNTSAFSGACIS
jgi:hypothetical protein